MFRFFSYKPTIYIAFAASEVNKVLRRAEALPKDMRGAGRVEAKANAIKSIITVVLH